MKTLREPNNQANQSQKSDNEFDIKTKLGTINNQSIKILLQVFRCGGAYVLLTATANGFK